MLQAGKEFVKLTDYKTEFRKVISIPFSSELIEVTGTQNYDQLFDYAS